MEAHPACCRCAWAAGAAAAAPDKPVDMAPRTTHACSLQCFFCLLVCDTRVAHTAAAASLHMGSMEDSSPPAPVPSATTPTYAVGVDLGTTNTVAYALRLGEHGVRPVALELDGNAGELPGGTSQGRLSAACLLRSALSVWYTASGDLRYTVGSDALDADVNARVTDSKRYIGRDAHCDAVVQDAAAAAVASASNMHVVPASAVPVDAAWLPRAPPVGSLGDDDVVLRVMAPHRGGAAASGARATPVHVTPQTVAGCLLARVAGAVAAACGGLGAVASTCITVPAYFADGPRRATVAAAVEAGLPNVSLVNEPTAAAVALGGLHGSLREESKRASTETGAVQLSPPQSIMVVDVGGGTLDVSALRRNAEGAVFVAAVGGDAHMGGVDVDRRLQAGILKAASAQGALQDALDAIDADGGFVERAKCALSSACAPRGDDGKVGGAPVPTSVAVGPMQLTTDALGDASEPLVHTALRVCRGVLATVQAKAGGPAAGGAPGRILLVGGSTRLPHLRHAVAQAWPSATMVQDAGSADALVAAGAVFHAAALAGSGAAVVRRDVAAMDIGVAAAAGHVEVLLPRGTPHGEERTVTLPTAHENQRIMALRVMEGTSVVAERNACLGTLRVVGLPRKPRGGALVTVRARVDASTGVLQVHASRPGTLPSEPHAVYHADFVRPVAPAYTAGVLAAAAGVDPGVEAAATALRHAVRGATHVANQLVDEMRALVNPPVTVIQDMQQAVEELWREVSRAQGGEVPPAALQDATDTAVQAGLAALKRHNEAAERFTAMMRENGAARAPVGAHAAAGGAAAAAPTGEASTPARAQDAQPKFRTVQEYLKDVAKEGDVIRFRNPKNDPGAAVAAPKGGGAAEHK